MVNFRTRTRSRLRLDDIIIEIGDFFSREMRKLIGFALKRSPGYVCVTVEVRRLGNYGFQPVDLGRLRVFVGYLSICYCEY